MDGVHGACVGSAPPSDSGTENDTLTDFSTEGKGEGVRGRAERRGGEEAKGGTPIYPHIPEYAPIYIRIPTPTWDPEWSHQAVPKSENLTQC